MERQQDVPSSSLYWSRNAKLKRNDTEYSASDTVTRSTEESEILKPGSSSEHDRQRDYRDGVDAEVNSDTPLRSEQSYNRKAPLRGNVYHFIRDEDVRRQKKHLRQPFKYERRSTSIQSPFTGAERREASLLAQKQSETVDPGLEAEKLAVLQDEADVAFTAAENASAKPSEQATVPPNPTGQQAGDWSEHPITKALKALTEPGNALNPAQVIADSLSPPVARQGRQLPNLGWGQQPDTQPSTPEEMPVKPISPGEGEAAAEEAARALDARDTFWDFWLSHQDQMRSQCIRLMAGNIADAEDALSSAMLRASQKFPSYSHSIVNGKAWLRKLVYNVCMDHYRQGKHTEYRAFDQESDIPLTGAMFTEPPQSPEDIALSQEQIRELDACIGSLSSNLRVPLFLRCVEGWSYPDIAEELNLRADTVRKRIQLARDHLRRSNIR